ncbi:MAG: PQQ-binding-like beta-propeller repeat protein [Planctomycetaceae bacterium]
MLRSFVVTAVIVQSISTGLQTSSGAEIQWPGWLGPKRDGWVSHFQPPTVWPEQLKQNWRIETGTGYGSPLVAGNRVFLHTRQAQEEVVWCFDLRTGDVRWRKSYSVPFKMGGGGERHGKGPKSSPVLAAGRLFTMSITGDLSAWDTDTGQLLWRTDYRSRFKHNHPYWGASTSPIVDDNRVIVHFGTDDEGALVALETETGKELWSQGSDGASYSSPLLVEIHGIRQIIDWNHNSLAGVDSRTGRRLWTHPFPHIGHNQNMPTPAFHNGHVLLGGENRGIYSLKPTLNGDTWTVRERWQQKAVALDMSTAVVNNNLLFGFSHYGKGRIFCLDTDTGDVLWQGPGRTGENVTFLAIPGHIVALISDGRLQILAATGNRFQAVATWQVAATPAWAPPVLLPDGVLVKDTRSLTLWSLPGATDRSPSGD